MKRKSLSLVASAGFAMLACGANAAFAQTAPSLGSAQSFAGLAGTTVTNTGPTTVNGSLGVSPGSAVTGFPPGLVLGGTIQAGTAPALAAQNSVILVYDNLAGQPCTLDLTGQDLGGLTLTQGVYCFTSDAFLTGTLTLDAQGNPNAVFIFKTVSTLITASGSTVSLINGGSLCNVFWQIGSSATLGTFSSFVGNILALTSITVNTGAIVAGRTLARNGALSLDSSSITATCNVVLPPPGCPAIAISPATLPNATVGVPYSQTFTGSGGTGPYTFAVISGAPPAGLTLQPAGILSGTPTTAGPYAFTMRGTDVNGCFAEVPYTLTVITAVPTLPQIFFIVLAMALTAIGYLRLRQSRSI